MRAQAGEAMRRRWRSFCQGPCCCWPIPVLLVLRLVLVLVLLLSLVVLRLELRLLVMLALLKAIHHIGILQASKQAASKCMEHLSAK